MKTLDRIDVFDADVEIELSHENIIQLNIALQHAAFDLMSDDVWYDADDANGHYEPRMKACVNGSWGDWLIWAMSLTEVRIDTVLLTRYHSYYRNGKDEWLDVISIHPSMRTVAPSKMVPQRMTKVHNVDMAESRVSELYEIFNT